MPGVVQARVANASPGTYDRQPFCWVMSKRLHMCSGTMAQSPGFYANRDRVTEDNAGQHEDSYYHGLIDLSEVLSRQLGRQMSQTAIYRVSYLSVSLRNNVSGDNNDNSGFQQGKFEWFSPTKHRIDALQALRKIDRQINAYNNSTAGANFAMPFTSASAGKMYKGLRYGFDIVPNGGNYVSSASNNELTSIFNGGHYYLTEVFDHYNNAMAGTPAGQGYDDAADEQGSALWVTRTAHDTHGRDSLHWSATLWNQTPRMQGIVYNPTSDDDEVKAFTPMVQDWEWDCGGNRHIELIGGLLKFDVQFSNTDTAGWLEDEYSIRVSVGVDGWSDF